jgi:hypothetical protein
LYSALYSAREDVVDSDGDVHKITIRKPTGHLGWGYYWIALPEKGSLVGVVTTKHKDSGIEDHAVVNLDLGKDWDCSNGITEYKPVNVIQNVITEEEIAEGDYIRVVPKPRDYVEGDDFDYYDGDTGVAIKPEGRTEVYSDSKNSDGVFSKFVSWLKRIFS